MKHPKRPTGARTRRPPKRNPRLPGQRGHPRRPTGERTRPRLKKSRMPLKHRNLRGGMATTVRRTRMASGITAARDSGLVRARACRAVPEQASGRGRRPRIAAGGADRSGAGSIARAVRLGANAQTGKTAGPPKRCRPRFRSRNPARQRNPQRRRRFGWDPEWPSESQTGGG